MYLYQELKLMSLNTTYTNKDHDELIKSLVGKPFSFFKQLKMRGVGSQRMIIAGVSPKLERALFN